PVSSACISGVSDQYAITPLPCETIGAHRVGSYMQAAHVVPSWRVSVAAVHPSPVHHRMLGRVSKCPPGTLITDAGCVPNPPPIAAPAPKIDAASATVAIVLRACIVCSLS